LFHSSRDIFVSEGANEGSLYDQMWRNVVGIQCFRDFLCLQCHGLM